MVPIQPERQSGQRHVQAWKVVRLTFFGAMHHINHISTTALIFQVPHHHRPIVMIDIVLHAVVPQLLINGYHHPVLALYLAHALHTLSKCMCQECLLIR